MSTGKDRLAAILSNKRKEAEAIEGKKGEFRKQALLRNDFRGFRSNLFQPGMVTVIAECKAASPTAGSLVGKYDPVAQAKLYEQGGAGAVSVLTDQEFFKGCLADMKKVREVISLPVLRKDFILTEAQVYESVAAGADAFLLIVAALTDEELKRLYELGKTLQADVLVEVHDLAEMDRALEIDADIIGINNRNLHTFAVDLKTTEELAPEIPSDCLGISESGIRTREDVKTVTAQGIHCLLVGETLMKDGDPANALRQLKA
ncbi:MAG: indole-3-glycerol phosphate synthase TrpC [Proteobacteria bacterium]|nr:indole-3-glycerol phosphate synthase TrpC [Pseudomonadota bacterium]NBS78701.1 indole-3-glycerol phosphate synthase TrpC [bacterium]NBV96121.1 indole-3-glycerol phosphate synthase TrpC [Verrucomicrobiota bacterium]